MSLPIVGVTGKGIVKMNPWDIETAPAQYRYYWIKALWDPTQPDTDGVAAQPRAQSGPPTEDGGGGGRLGPNGTQRLGFVIGNRTGPVPISFSAFPLGNADFGTAAAWIGTPAGLAWRLDALHVELAAVRID